MECFLKPSVLAKVGERQFGNVPGSNTIQGTKLGPWLFTTMINNFNIPTTAMWKYVDDSTISETVMKSEACEIHQIVHELVAQTSADKFQPNKTMCKELCITFSHSKARNNFDPIEVNGQDLECLSMLRS